MMDPVRTSPEKTYVTYQPHAEKAVTRQAMIRDYLTGRKAVTTHELAKHVGVSAVTLRRDLGVLEELGVIERVHGGARLAAPRPEVEEQFSVREHRNPDAKAWIGRCVAALVEEGESLAMNDGTTVMQVARAILDAETGCSVTTNALNVALVLSDGDRLDVTVLGGLLRRSSFGTYSPVDDGLVGISFDTAILGIESMDLDDGVHLDHQFDLVIARRMMARAARVVIVADSSKWSRRGRVRLAAWDDVDILVTDSCPPESRATLSRRGVEVVEPPEEVW
jgi:DeoR/GlpR family transcriptional regulator of sugar metabolism